MARVVAEIEPIRPKEDEIPNSSSPDELESSAQDVASRLREKLKGAESEGIVGAIEVKGSNNKSSKSSSATKPETEQAQTMLKGMDLSLISDVLWDSISQLRGYDEIGVPVDGDLKERWAKAATPVFERLMQAMAIEYPEGVILAGLTLLIMVPRETVRYKHRKRQGNETSSNSRRDRSGKNDDSKTDDTVFPKGSSIGQSPGIRKI